MAYLTHPKRASERLQVKAVKFGENLKKCVTAFYLTQSSILFEITMNGLPQNLGL